MLKLEHHVEYFKWRYQQPVIINIYMYVLIYKVQEVK
jgi:hypothetical protein